MGDTGVLDRGLAGGARIALLALAALLVSPVAGRAQPADLPEEGEAVAAAETPDAARDGAAALDAAMARAAASEDAREALDGTSTLAPAPAETDAPAALAEGGVSLFVAGHRTGAQRYSDFYLTSGKPRRRPVAVSMRLRRADDANFTNRTRHLARRAAEIGRPVGAPQLAIATTGAEFLEALMAASRAGPIANLVVYGHAAPNALFMREDRGFYGAVIEVARDSHVVSGEIIDKDEQLRLAGARDLYDLEQLIGRGEIAFTRNAVIVFAGCGVAGKRDIEPRSIAARMAEITGAKVIASIDVTDQSKTRGRNFRDQEYSRRSWVRFIAGQPPERLNSKVIDALKQLNFTGATVAAGPEAAASLP